MVLRDIDEKEGKYCMKSILLLLFLVLCLGVSTSSFAADSYICIGDKKIYFFNDNKNKECRSIVEESYNVYIIERHKNAKYTWRLRKSGETYLCDEYSNESEYLLCDLMGDFKMFKQNLKFLNFYLDNSCYTTDYYGKVTGETGMDVPYIEIGRCHPF